MNKKSFGFKLGFLWLAQIVFIQTAAFPSVLKEKLEDPKARAWLKTALQSDKSLQAHEIDKILNGSIAEMGTYFSRVFQEEFRKEDLVSIEERINTFTSKYPSVVTQEKITEVKTLIQYLKVSYEARKIDEKFILSWISLESYIDLFQYFKITHVYLKTAQEDIYRYLTYCLDDYLNVFKHLNKNDDKDKISKMLTVAESNVVHLKEQFEKFQNQNIFYMILLRLRSLESAQQLAPTVSATKVRNALRALISDTQSQHDLERVHSILKVYFRENRWNQNSDLTQKLEVLKLQVLCSHLHNQECDSLLYSIDQANDLESLKNILPDALRSLQVAVEAELRRDPLKVLLLTPSEARNLILQNIIYYRFILDQLKENYIKELTLAQKTLYWRKNSFLNSIDKLDTALAEYFLLVRKSSSLSELRVFYRERGLFGSFINLAFESFASSSQLTVDYANYFEKQIHSKKQNKKNKLIDTAFFEILKKDRKEGVYQAWVNKENALVLTVSVSLAVTAVVTCGTSLVTSTAAIATLQSISLANTIITRSVFVSMAGYNLTERYHKEGWDGLKNSDSLLDTMMIIMSVVPSLKTLHYANGSKGVLTKSSQVFLNTMIRSVNYTPAAWVSFVGGRGIYYYYNAEKLAKEFQAEGMTYVTAEEVRKEALKQIGHAARAGFVRFVVPTKTHPLPSPRVVIPAALVAPVVVSLPALDK